MPFVLLASGVAMLGLGLPHEAKANWIGGFNCFDEPDCVNGWNAGVAQAPVDWNSGLYSHSLNGGDLNCWANYTTAECHGFIHGYIYEWSELWQQHHIGGSEDNGGGQPSGGTGE